MQNVIFDHQNYYTDTEAALILKATEFAFGELGIPPSTKLEIRIKENDPGSGGYCHELQELFLTFRELDILLLDALFHEITHLQQYLAGKLFIIRQSAIYVWYDNGNPLYISAAEVNNMFNTYRYRHLPWEYEANHQAYRIIQKFILANPDFEVCQMQANLIQSYLPSC